MDVTIDINKTVNQNAAIYFERSKKAKKKIVGAEEVVKKTEKELAKLLKEKELFEKEEKEAREKEAKFKDRKKEWFEKFRWFYTSTNLLVIGGRDATTNEIVIKKHTDKDDLVFHTDMAGSPFFVLKTKGKPTKTTLKEVADATCTFSRAWKLGLQSQDVFYVNPEQVSKKQEAGTAHLAKGAFMIYGKTNYLENKTNLCIGITKDNAVMSGPCEAIKKHCKNPIQFLQGEEKASSIAKKIHHLIGGDLDEIIRALPSGSFKIKK